MQPLLRTPAGERANARGRLVGAFGDEGTVDVERGGAGLALAIARRIVELHGGEIAADSAAGEGARSWFSLPVAAGS